MRVTSRPITGRVRMLVRIYQFASFTDTSAPRHLGTYIRCRSVPDPSAPVPKCLIEDTSGRCGRPWTQQANRTLMCPYGSTCPGPCPAVSPHYTSYAAFVGRLQVVVSLVLSRLDYGNATFAGQPGNQLDRLQSVMNAAARLVCSARKYEHITPLLRDLHWLRVPERIEFKLSVLVFRCLHGTALPYLASELRHVVDVDTKKRL